MSGMELEKAVAFDLALSCLKNAVDELRPGSVKGRLQAPPPARVATDKGRPARVGVFVGLFLRPEAGGHVRCWVQLAQAATRHPDEVDLTVHFLGETEGVRALSDNVRFRLHCPRFSTERLQFLSHIPDHTDLALHHRELARYLGQYDVLHTTDAFFSFARTALRFAGRSGVPLVNSVHTNTPSYTRVFTTETIERLAGKGFFGGLLTARLGVPGMAERYMHRQLLAHQRASAFALVSRADDSECARRVLPAERVRMLRRGVDCAEFSPAKRDRRWLAETFGVPAQDLAVLFVGRLNRGKNVLVLADAVAQLRARGLPVHLVCAGDGEDREAIRQRLGPHVCCPGVIQGEALARLYASADIFAMPSEIEVFSNVVLEAIASGLPAIVSAHGGMSWLVKEGVTGLVVNGQGIVSWTQALSALHADRARLAAMARAARVQAESELCTWERVLTEDLLPVWRQAANGKL